jgi:hypothetical protein
MIQTIIQIQVELTLFFPQTRQGMLLFLDLPLKFPIAALERLHFQHQFRDMPDPALQALQTLLKGIITCLQGSR